VNSDSLAVMAGGLKEIATADVSTGRAGVALVVLVMLALLPYYVPIVMFAVAPRRAAVLLRDFSNWLLEHTRKVEIVTGIVLGGAFLWKGLATLL
jgi:hypothetical protein